MTEPATLEQLLAQLERTGDREVADTARRAISAVLDLHRDGLAQVVRALARAPELRAGLLRDPAVAALLLLHGLHPDPLADRVARAAAQVRSAGFAVEVVHADADGVRARVSAEATRLLEAALLEHAPDAGPLEVLRPDALIPAERLVRRAACELCGAAIGEAHEHVGRGEREVLCVCTTCAHTSEEPGLPLRLRAIDASLSEAAWRRLGIPVELAFIVERAPGERLAVYPGPAGLVESPIDATTWLEVAGPALATDSEALLCDRLSSPPRYYRASLAACYAVAGLLRRHWSGGRREAWAHVRGFIDGLAGGAA
jgi:hypothetical protein